MLPSAFTVPGLIFWTLLIYLFSLVYSGMMTPIAHDLQKSRIQRMAKREERRRKRYERIHKGLGLAK